jgi:hypothetical protein
MLTSVESSTAPRASLRPSSHNFPRAVRAVDGPQFALRDGGLSLFHAIAYLAGLAFHHAWERRLIKL